MTPTPAECTRLASELRTLRERSGLALTALAAASPYSKSSWQRYLSGRSLPPWPAVQLLCRVADEPEARARALWELAETAWSRRTATLSVPVPPVEPPVPTPVRPGADEQLLQSPEKDPADPTGAPVGLLPQRRRVRLPRIAAAVAATVVVCCVALVLSAGHRQNPRPGLRSAGPASTAVFQVACTGTGCTGKDPQTTGCGVEPQTLLHQQIRGGFGVEIRYNPQCRAAWARIWDAKPADRLTLATPGQPLQTVTVAHPGDLDPFVYTPLIATTTPGLPLTACVAISAKAKPTCYAIRRP